MKIEQIRSLSQLYQETSDIFVFSRIRESQVRSRYQDVLLLLTLTICIRQKQQSESEFIRIYIKFFSYSSQDIKENIKQKKMEPQQIKTTRQLLRNIQCTTLYRYLILPSQKKELGYRDQCIANPQNPELYEKMIGIDCEMIETDIGQQIVRAVILEQDGTVIYNKWYNIKDGTQVIDYLTHITGITEQILNKNCIKGDYYSDKHKTDIQAIIKGKIIVGHDLANDIRVLQINHSAFIDTVCLLPHNFGLPFKSKLRDLVATYLGKHIQWNNHDPIEDALAAVELVRFHVSQGKGTIQIQPFPEKKYESNSQILKDAELDPAKISFFALRGSRALDMVIETPDYKSDYDYVVVYNTSSQINSRLIKLPQIDITILDENSFQNSIKENDIAYLELFFLPKHCIFVNKFQFPRIYLQKLRQSLGFHLNKSAMKYKRIKQLINEKPSYKWKILKTVHMKMRFMDDFLQFYEALTIAKKQQARNNKKLEVNINRLRPLWLEVEQQYKQTNDYETVLNKLEKKERLMKEQINKIFPKKRKLRFKGHQISRLQYKNRKKVRQIKINQNFQQYQVQIMNKQKYSQEKKLRNLDHLYQRRNRSRRRNYNTVQSTIYRKMELNPIHNKLHTVKMLKKYGTQPFEQFKIICKRHRKYPNLIQLHYMQSASFNSMPPRQCRGLIVDEDRDYSVVALPYYKFFDYNDPKYSQLDQLDLKSAKVYQKKDGSIAFLYYYDNQWNVASSTIPDGTNSYCFGLQQTTTQFKSEFWKIFHQLNYKEPSIEDKDKTFIFQIMSKNHIIVVKRSENDLCLHGVRDIKTLQEEDHIKYGEKYNWRVTKPLDIEFKNINELVDKVNKLDPLQTEGYVVCDKNWVRVKVKSAGYVRINWLGELNQGFNKDPKKYILIEVVLSGEAETFINYCPEWKNIIKEYLQKIKRLNNQIAQIYQRIQHLSKKEFAQQARKYSKDFQSFLFAVRGKEQMYLGKVQHVLNPKKFFTFITNY